MQTEVKISQLTAQPSTSEYWRHVGVDPATVVRTERAGDYSAAATDGSPVVVTDAYLREAIEHFARGGCPRCGGRWGEAHASAGSCPAPGTAQHD